MGYSSAAVFYKTMFALVQHHKYSLTEVECMYPYERDIFVEMLTQYMEKLEQDAKST